MKKLLALILLLSAPLGAQSFPAATSLSGQPFFIKKTWILGGAGNWGSMTMDTAARRLYIPHGSEVQVVNVETGALTGAVTGLREARAVALDREGSFGYVSDGRAYHVKVFDRDTLQVVAEIPTAPNPGALILEPQTGLLFAVCTGSSTADKTVKSTVAVIDIKTRKVRAEIVLAGRLGFAEDDKDGHIFILMPDRNQIVRIEATEVADLLHTASAHAGEPLKIDWSGAHPPPSSTGSKLAFFPLGADCGTPRALAVDGRHERLFTACENMKMVVADADTGSLVTSLSIGPGADSVGYDPDHGLIFTANGGAAGTLTVIRQDVTDTYAVIQNLPTLANARTLAVDPASNRIYLVTVLTAVKLGNPPMNGLGTLKFRPANATFMVLVVGY